MNRINHSAAHLAIFESNKLRTMQGLPIVLLSLLTTTWGLAQAPPTVQWQRNLGGSGDDLSSSIQQTIDGGFILCGTTFSNNGDVSGNHGNSDAWVVKLDAAGNIQWQRCLGGTQPDNGKAILEHPDGGYLMLGSTYSNNGNVSGNHGSSDVWIIRLDSIGGAVWQRCYGGTLMDDAAAIVQVMDGGFIIAGSSRSSNGDLTTNAGSTDFWVLKIDGAGSIVWQRSYGGSSSDNASDIALTPDGGCVVIGTTGSDDGDITGAHGFSDVWVMKLDNSGDLEWQRACGGSGEDFGVAIGARDDGTIITTGFTDSIDGDVSIALGSNDMWSLKISGTGQLLNERSYGGSNSDVGSSLKLLGSEGVTLTGSTRSMDGDLSMNQGMVDGWIFRTDSIGTILWSKTLGGGLSDSFQTLQGTDDGGYICAGQSSSNDGDIPGNNGGGDVWVVKFGPDHVGIREAPLLGRLALYPNPCTDRLWVLSTRRTGEPTGWQIVDVQGRIASEGPLDQGTNGIDVSQLCSGAYSLVMQWADGRVTAPFMKD